MSAWPAGTRTTPEASVASTRAGSTAVAVTHDQAAALAISDRVVVMSAGPLVGVADLPPAVRGAEADARLEIPGATLAAIERHAILTTLESTGGSTTKAAAILGVTTRTIQYRLQEYRRAEKLDRPALVGEQASDD